jgi:gliding motility-associated-like protein
MFQKMIAHGTVASTFYWQTNCLHVRKQPYQITFKATNHYKNLSLTSLKTVRITVVSPAPQNLQAVPFQNTISLSWNPTPCSNAVGYKIYRRVNSSGFVPAHCETGVPEYTGYKQIGTTNINTRTFIDDNNGIGLLRGTKYCYLVIAYFIDGAESYASNEVCVFLKKDVPIITNVSILETDNSMGKIEVKWVKPSEFDSVQYPGPYYYTINRSVNNSSNFTNLATYHSLDSLQFIDNLQNTKDNTFFYRIDFYNNTNTPPFLIGSSDIASSVFLTITPTDRKLILSWNEQVPWENENYIIYRENSGIFDSIGQTNLTTFTDFDLNNNQTYCYYIEAYGKYADATLPFPLLNLSQIACEIPIDNVPPCAPVLWGTTDCKDIEIEWSFDFSCDLDDVYMLYLYYRNDLSADYLILDSILHPRANYRITNLPSIVGCFFLMARDFVGNHSNYSNELCFDTDICDKYRLPNVFTPNGDGVNDFFMPFPYDYVESINMHIYNRWGELVFKTTNPDVLWDGTSQFTKQPCAAGVYFYVCDVNEYTLNGIRTRHLNGSVTLLR